MRNNHTYFMVLVNDIIKDYSLDYNTAATIANGYKKVTSTISNVQILEMKVVKTYDERELYYLHSF